MQNQTKNFTSQLIQNIVAGLTVSFVALSLGAAFGVLSGRGAFAGMLSAALIASITAALGGTRLQTSGPTGPMTAVTAVLVATAHDRLASQLPGVSPSHFVNIVLFLTAGLLGLGALFRLGKFITYVPNVVVSGFMNGIAIIIWLDQFKKLFGWGGKVAFEGPIITNLILTLVSLGLVFLIPPLTRKWLPKAARLLSGTLLALVIMTAVSVVLHLPVERVVLESTLRSWGDVTHLLTEQWPTTWSWEIVKLAWPWAGQLAVLAYLDTLLTSLVMDKLTGEKTRQNKELAAQGVATAAVAAVGGIPGAQATIRSVLIVKEKATWRLAGILVGVFALVEMVLLQDLISLIPQAVFAGILIKVGYDVFDWLPLRLYGKEWFRSSGQMLHNFFSRHDDEPIFVTHRELMMIVGTTLVTVIWDLNMAVAVFTVLFYVFNKLLMRRNPMRDLKPSLETEGITDQP